MNTRAAGHPHGRGGWKYSLHRKLLSIALGQWTLLGGIHHLGSSTSNSSLLQKKILAHSAIFEVSTIVTFQISRSYLLRTYQRTGQWGIAFAFVFSTIPPPSYFPSADLTLLLPGHECLWKESRDRAHERPSRSLETPSRHSELLSSKDPSTQLVSVMQANSRSTLAPRMAHIHRAAIASKA